MVREGWRRVALGDVAALDIERVPVRAGRRYEIAGVLNGGKGLFERETIDASQTNYPALHRLRTGQLVMRKLTAWEGPITCVPPEFDGRFVSAEFPTFTLRPALLPSYMSLVCQQPTFWEAMKDRSTGTVQRRKRVNPSELLAISLDLPSLADQRRIIDLVAAVDEHAQRANGVAEMSHRASLALFMDWQSSTRAQWVTLKDVCDLGSGSAFPERYQGGRGGGIPFYKVSDMNRDGNEVVMTGAANYVDEEPARTLRARVHPPGTVIFPKVGAALLTEKRRRLGMRAAFDNNVMGLVPQVELIDPTYLFWCMRGVRLGDLAQVGALPSVNQGHVAGITIPLPDLVEQRRISGAAEALLDVGRLAAHERDRIAAVRSSALDAALRGDLEIPVSYDRFLDGAA